MWPELFQHKQPTFDFNNTTHSTKTRRSKFIRESESRLTAFINMWFRGDNPTSNKKLVQNTKQNVIPYKTKNWTHNPPACITKSKSTYSMKCVYLVYHRRETDSCVYYSSGPCEPSQCWLSINKSIDYNADLNWAVHVLLFHYPAQAVLS